jgi:serine/threonine protein kinase
MPSKTDPQNDWIGWWLEWEHHGYVVDRVLDGSYGRVWVLSNPQAYPRGFAAKSFRVLPNPSVSGPDLRDLFEREIALWMRVPPHFNTVTALGIDMAPNPSSLGVGSTPIVRMPLFDGSLRSWIDSLPRQDEPNCLIALAQLCNGLTWLYAHGVQGHGDLKPENVLFKDLTRDFRMEPGGFPKWRIVVADLGWANAWSALGLSDRAWRPYLAPERTHPGFDPHRGDSFAFGVIAAEVLTGVHPAGERTERIGKWKRQRWFDWAQKGIRHLATIQDATLRSIVERCLSPSPSDRPEPSGITEELAAILTTRFGIPYSAWQDALNAEAEQHKMLHPGWANEQIARVGEKLRQDALEDLRKRLKSIDDDNSLRSRTEAIWIIRSLSFLLSRGEKISEWQEAYDLAVTACQGVVDGFHSMDWSGALVYVPEGMSRQEIALTVINDLLEFLTRIGGVDLPEVTNIRERVRNLIATEDGSDS